MSNDIGQFLISEFFKVVKETDPTFNTFKHPEDILNFNKNEKTKDTLKFVRFSTLCLELFNCAKRFKETFPKNKKNVQVNPYTEMFLSSNFSTKEEFDNFIGNFTLEVVFTTHPTEVFPLSLLKNLNRIEMLLEKFFSTKVPETRHRYLQALRANLTTLWLTDEIYRAKPSPEDEADRLFYVFETSLWKANPYFFRRYYFEYKKRFDSSPKKYPNLKFSSWIGGDRDGNPFVTSEATYNIVTKSRRKILRLILLELYPLREEILIKSSQPELKKLYKDAAFPYKALFVDLVEHIQDTLKNHKTNDVLKLQSYVLERLKLAYTLLCKDGGKRVADRRLRSLIDRVQAFSLSPFKLDLRQDSEVHTQIIDELKELTKSKGELDVKKARKVSFEKLSPLGQDFFKTLRLSKDFSPNPFNCYIISMTRSAQDIKNLETLFTVAMVEKLPIVPLFETPDDVRNSSNIIKECKKLGVELKQVMWGYSDSTKKGGRLASAWSVYNAQIDAMKLNPDLVHFHGRGGSIARGGGSIENSFGLMPAGVVGNHFRQTFQGEVIQDDFGLFVRAVQTLEKTLKECTINYFKKEQVLSKKVRQEIDDLAHKSEMKFQKKFYNDQNFSDVFAEKSPISIISKMNLGSRPAKRSSKISGVSSYRAIPWVFSWSQTRGSLPVWYGLQGLENKLLSLKSKSRFINNFIESISIGIGLTDPHIFSQYFKNELTDVQKDLESVKSKIPAPNGSSDLKDLFVNYLHKHQIKMLEKNSVSPIEEEIEKITAQGIACYLGRSG
ncbi:MAG: phosphoenolpyruvate carboxylase [Bdellovibrionales bacterium]